MPTKKKFFQTSFYKNERKNRNILMTGDSPQGGKLTFDSENRKKYPKGKTPPSIQFPNKTNYHKEAEKYVEINFFTVNANVMAASLEKITAPG